MREKCWSARATFTGTFQIIVGGPTKTGIAAIDHKPVSNSRLRAAIVNPAAEASAEV